MQLHPYRIHVVLKKEDISEDVVGGRVAVVIDVLFATSTIVAALAEGATEVVPALDPDDATRLAQGRDPASFLLAGEDHLRFIPGFAPPFPLAVAAHGVNGRSLIYSTTNGTVALRGAQCARAVYAAALLNAPATARHLVQEHAGDDWVIVCAGSRGNTNMEDLFAAGLIIDTLAAARQGRWMLSDNAAVARSFFLAWQPDACLRASRLGHIITDLGHEPELAYAARVGAHDFVCELRDGVIRRRPAT